MKTILVDGGTTAHGLKDEASGAWAGGWAQRLRTDVSYGNGKRRYGGVEVDILAEPKRTILDVAKSVGHLPLNDGSVAALVVAVGVDEVSQGMQPLMFECGLHDIAHAVDAEKTSLIFVGPEPVAYRNSLERRSAVWCSTQLAETAGRIGAQFIDTEALFGPFASCQIMQENGMDPNSFGHELLFQFVKQSLERVHAI